ncbi:MAG: hypothetical protein WBF52_04995, partial [Geitlerinemataceae cyanobacterium]
YKFIFIGFMKLLAFAPTETLVRLRGLENFLNLRRQVSILSSRFQPPDFPDFLKRVKAINPALPEL